MLPRRPLYFYAGEDGVNPGGGRRRRQDPDARRHIVEILIQRPKRLTRATSFTAVASGAAGESSLGRRSPA